MMSADSYQDRSRQTVSAMQTNSPLRTIASYLKLFAIALILALVIKVSLVEAYKIPSESMQNTLLVGDYLLANKFIYGSAIPLTDIRLPSVREPQAGDIIVFRYPEDPKKNFVKRLIAVGGQTVEIKNKEVFVDGEKLTGEMYAIHTDPTVFPGNAMQPRDNFGPIRVPQGYYFVMGDNRDNSADSRFWGCVPRELILGKAFLIHWSWKPDPHAPDVKFSEPLSLLHSFAYNVWHLAERIRWERLFSSIK